MKQLVIILQLLFFFSFSFAQTLDSWESNFDHVGKFRGKVAVVQKDGKFGAVNKTGEVIVPLDYQQIKKFVFDIAAAKKDDKWGYIKSDGSTLIEFKYDAAESMNTGFTKVKKDSLWGIINRKGNMLIPFQYDSIKSMNYGYYLAQKGSLKGVIKRGKIFLPNAYDDVRVESNYKLVKTLKKEPTKPLGNASTQNLAPEEESRIYIHARLKGALEIYNDRGILVREFEFAASFKKGVAIATDDGIKVYINKIGTVLDTID